jgi:hypothetical protein
MPRQPYPSEDVLQRLIAGHPDVLAGDQVDPDHPPRWLLVGREVGVPDAESASDRWSADHLLLDQRAIPTIVEVKRADDTRIGREVDGQMLDYASNAARTHLTNWRERIMMQARWTNARKFSTCRS